ncbi:hypothetical protein EDC04DRAFT_2575555 [Pisolithus marmoratus]|nr:hypothetical protein EDC04DRAFT_2575555 [Pisolithus marmoratus]
MQVDFYPIPICNLNKLIHTKMAFNIKTAELFSGNIRLDCSIEAIVGVGAFKIAQSAQLMLSPLTCSGINSILNYEIILKWPYISNSPNECACPPFTQFTLKDELNILYCEANVLYWAKALLKMTYEFVDHSINVTKEWPPFDIPCLQFVDAGLLLAYLNALSTTEDGALPSVKTSSIGMIYLGEELIPTTPSDGEGFVKYIHNGDAVPCDFLDPEEENIAQFLAFTQHVQYIKTGGQVYILDYQGNVVLILNMLH